MGWGSAASGHSASVSRHLARRSRDDTDFARTWHALSGLAIETRIGRARLHTTPRARSIQGTLHRFEGRIDGRSFAASAPPALLRDMVAEYLDARAAKPEIAPAGSHLVLEHLMYPALLAFEERTGTSVAFERCEVTTADDAAGWPASFETPAGARVTVLLDVPAELALLLGDMSGGAGDTAPDFPIRLSIAVGAMWIRRRELLAFGGGDAVLLHADADGRDGATMVFAGGLVGRAELRNGELTMTDGFRELPEQSEGDDRPRKDRGTGKAGPDVSDDPKESGVSQAANADPGMDRAETGTSEESGSDDAAADEEHEAAAENGAPGERMAARGLDAMTLLLTFEIGSRTVSLSDLKLLAAGSALEVGRFEDDVVKLRANGALIGGGRLVNLDDRLAVEVTWIEKSDV